MITDAKKQTKHRTEVLRLAVSNSLVLDTVIAVFVHMTLQDPLSLVKATESFPVRSPSCQTIQYLLSGYCVASKYRFQEPFSYAPL